MSDAHRVLVTGGRDYGHADGESEVLNRFLDEYHANRPITVLGHGGAPGADSAAAHWAKWRSVPCLRWPAQWEKLGRSAGMIRNAALLAFLNPHVCIAFPGGAGTADMVRRCRAAGVEVVEVER